MEIIMRQVPIYGAAAFLVALAVAGCNGTSPDANPPPVGMTQMAGKSSTGNIIEYLIPRLKTRPKTFPIGITTADGALWIAERGLGKLARMTADGIVTDQLRIKGKARFPQNVVMGLDGNLWATVGSTHTYHQSIHARDPYGAVVGMTTAGLPTYVFQLPMYSDPRDITSGPDGNIWFTEFRGAIGKVTLGGSSGDTLAEFPTPLSHAAFGIADGPDGAIWFCELLNDRIGRIDPNTDVITMFRMSKKSGPVHLVTGPNDGYMYVTERFISKVAQVTTAGTIVREFALSAGSHPEGIALGADGNLYVTEFDAGKIAEITLPNGVVTEVNIPTSGSRPWDIIGGPDGNIWFTESATGKIGKMSPSSTR
jgi:streptogramin lyase